MAGGTHIRHTFGVHDKCGDMPGHHKNAHGAAQQEHAHEIDLTQVFWSQQQRYCAEVGGKMSGNG